MRKSGPPSEIRRLAAPVARLIDGAWQRMHWWIATMAILYVLSGITIVKSDEVAVILRWGRLVGDTPALQEHGPGLLFAFPQPVDQVVRVQVKRVSEVPVDTLIAGVSDEEEDVDMSTLSPLQGYAITGDHNIVHVSMMARYRVREPAEWAFYGAKSEDILRVEVTAAMVRSLGEMGVDRVLADGRKSLIATATARAQAGLDASRSGLELTSLELTTLTPPVALISQFDEVQSAFIGAETKKKDAQAFAESAVPQAQGEADRLIQSAHAEASAELAQATGDAAAFLALAREYRANPVVVRERLYRDAVERAIGMAGSIRWVPPPVGARYQGFRITVGSPKAAGAGPGGRRPMSQSIFGVAIPDNLAPAEPDIPVSLDAEERRRISTRLGAGLAGIGLLGLGTLLVRLEPDQWQIGELCRGLAAAIVGIPTLISGIRGVVTGDTRRATDQLVAIAILAAAATGDFVTATLIPLFLEIGRLFEERSSLGARATIEGIRALGARQAVRWRNGIEEKVEPNALSTGDEILVRPGERIAVDGIVLEGRAAVDQSAITGEAVHEDVGPGSPVFAGTVALDGLLKIQVRGVGSDTVLGRVVQLLAEVERTTVPVLRLFEQRAGVWLPLVLTLAGTVLFFTHDLSRAIAMLVVAAPTALVVAGPAAVVAAMTVATRLRILIKSADFFERASDVDTLILDKTGTVTVGAPVVTEIQPRFGVSENRLLAVAASCGFGSLHPVSRAVVAEALRRGILSTPPKDLQERPGLGVVATVDGWEAILGRRALLAELGVDTGFANDESVSHVYVAQGGRCLGVFLLQDQPRAEAHEALAAMRALGIDRLILLTGDREAAARKVGEALGMDEVVAEVLPAQKLDVVRAEQSAGRTVMMVGDGVNDALALAGADVGVAIGAELNEVALGGADVALLGTDLGRLPRLVGLADITRRVIGQNVWLAFGLSVILLALAAQGILNPLTGALSQSVAVLFVVANSARILRFSNQVVPTAHTNAKD